MYSVSLPSSYTKPNNQKKDHAQNLYTVLNLPKRFFCKSGSAGAAIHAPFRIPGAPAFTNG